MGLCITFFVHIATQQVFGQFYKPSAVTVRMGETLPESFYQTVHQAVNAKTGKGTTIKLADYRDKLIILDFWATWCGPCIASLNKLDSMRAGMDTSGFVVIPVNYQSAQEASATFKKFRWDMTSIVSDTSLSQIFPHGGIPHQVWVKDGKVLLMPKWKYANREVITAVLNGKKPKVMLNIQDQVLDARQPVLAQVEETIPVLAKKDHSLLFGYLRDYRIRNLQYLRKADSTILLCSGLSLKQLFYQAYKDRIFPHLSGIMGAGIHWKADTGLGKAWLSKPGHPELDDYSQDSIETAWKQQHYFGYELRYPGYLGKEEAMAIMQRDLDDYFGKRLGIVARIKPVVHRKYPVLRLLESRPEAEKALTAKTPAIWKSDKSTFRYKNSPFGKQFYYFVDGALYQLPGLNLSAGLVDSTGIDPDLITSSYFPQPLVKATHLGQVNSELKRYGMYVTIEDRMVPALVISGVNEPK